MFGLARLLFLGGTMTWQPRGTVRWPKRRRPSLDVEQLEERLVPALLGQKLFPADYPWNQNISNAPVAANSQAIITHIGGSIGLHPDWGEDSASNGSNPLYGIPYNVVHGNSVAKVNVIIDNYPGESDIVPVPIPANAVIEGDFQNGPNNTGQRGDSHLIVWDQDNNIAYELYGAARPTDPVTMAGGPTGGNWHAAQESVWNMNAESFRSLGWTSADAAGLSLLAGLVRPDEALPTAQGGQGVIDHALRFTLPSGDVSPQYIYPASHVVSTSAGSTKLPFGARLRLKNTPAVNAVISGLQPQAQVIAHAMQQYGLVLADIGSAMYISGTSSAQDSNNNISLTWNMDDVLGLHSLTAANFDVIDLTPQVTGLSTTSGAAGDTITVIGQNFSGAAGHLSVLFGGTGTTAGTPSPSVTYVDDSHLTVVVPTGTGTVNVQVQSGVLATDPNNPTDNVNNPVFGYGTSSLATSAQFTYGAAQTISGVNSTASFASGTAVSGTTDALTVIVKDVASSPVSGLNTSVFGFAFGGGTSVGTFGTVTETATPGTYTVNFTGTTAGTVSTLTITVKGVALSTKPTITVTTGTVSGTVSTVNFATPTVASGGTDTVTVVVADGAGNAVSGLANGAFGFALGAGVSAGTFGTVSETATPGTYTATFTATTAGTASTLTTTVSGVALASTPTIHVLAGGISAANSSVAFATNSVMSGSSDTVTIAVKDGAGNPVSGLANNAFGLALAGGTSAGAFGGVTESATPGTYTATFTGTTPGTASTLTATVGGVVLATHPAVTVTAVTVSSTHSTVSFGSPTVSVGSVDVVTIVVADSAGTPISGLSAGAFVLALGNGTSAGTIAAVTETATPGTYVTSFTATVPGTASVLTATVSGVTLVSHPAITVTTGPSGLIATNLPVFSWIGVAGAESYTVWLADQTTGAVTVVPNLSGNSWTPPQPLTLGDMYTWWIGAVHGQTTSWNDGNDFRIAPTAAGPSDTIGTAMPAFTWNTVVGATSYKVWLTDQTTGQTTVVPDLPGTSWTPPEALALGDSYMWWVGAVNGATVGWNDGLSFRVAPKALGPSGAITVNIPVFTWNTVTGAASYEVWLADLTTGQVTDVPNVNGTTWSPSQPLTFGDDYTWWVGAMEGGIVGWNDGTQFRIAPTASGPSGVVATNLPVFGWNTVSGAGSYEVWLLDETTGQTTITPNINGQSWTPTQALPLGDSYVWWVGAVQGQAVGWSGATHFRIGPTASGPSGGVASNPPQFTWNNVTGAASYEVWLTNVTTGQTETVPNLQGTSFTPDQPLTAGEYIWWVGAVGVDGTTGWDEALTFTI